MLGGLGARKLQFSEFLKYFHCSQLLLYVMFTKYSRVLSDSTMWDCGSPAGVGGCGSVVLPSCLLCDPPGSTQQPGYRHRDGARKLCRTRQDRGGRLVGKRQGKTEVLTVAVLQAGRGGNSVRGRGSVSGLKRRAL